MKKSRILSLALLLITLGGCYFYVAHYKKEPNDFLSSDEPYARISADSLLAIFTKNEDLIDTSYIEKLIEVEGKVKEITFLNNQYGVLLYGKSKSSYVLCDISDSELNITKKIKVGDTIKLKGICKGYLLDVVMLNCKLVKK